ncbi:MAG: response regulator transcription factor [Deltaproteobacteria bacterium]|nr:response regulator transcription factor [Deltaproteobacteria bacterium]
MASLADSVTKEWAAYIVGRQNIQKGLLASFLEREFGFRCHVADNGCDYPSPELMADRSLLLVRDCSDDNEESLRAYLAHFGERLLHDDRLYVVLINLNPEFDLDAELLQLGVRGVLNANAAPGVMLRFITSVIRGELWFPRQLVSRCILESRGVRGEKKEEEEIPAPALLPVALTAREKEVLMQVGMGATNDQIADRLCISQHTVKSHVYRIFRKINVPNRLQAALWATKYLS